ncbi:hypothetical protein [Candidatus Clostridium stratigraminis]|uniref:Uncharacterized protein n=1 Tax=Candidatus Clostridium stratigraminis TaxID=3381661 RepID=A0ABW8T0B9_9CLOT
MDKSNKNKKDKLLASQSTTGSYGISNSANLTIESSGTDGDDNNSFFPNFHEEKSWSSKTSAIIDDSK